MYRQNWLFEIDQKKLNKELSEVIDFNNETAIEEESKQLWVDIWNRKMDPNNKANWLQNLKPERHGSQQDDLEKAVNIVRKKCNKLPRWKAPGMGGVQDCYIKMLNSMQERTGRQLNEILNRRNPLPAWMTNGQSFL